MEDVEKREQSLEKVLEEMIKMEKNARLAFRILASLYPDKKPSEIKKIISDALKKEERPEDMELWMILTKDAEEDKKEESKPDKKVIEEHHYYHHDYGAPWYYATPTINCDDSTETNKYTFTCNDVSNTIGTISSDCITLSM